MKKYTKTIQEAEEYLEDIVDERFVINALKAHYEGERNMLLYPFTSLDIYEYEVFMFGEHSPIEYYVEDNTLYAVMNSDMESYLRKNWGMIQTKHDTDSKEFFYVDEYGKEYVIPYIEEDDQIVLVVTGTYKLENKDETMK